MGLVGTVGGYYLYRSIRKLVGWNFWRGIGAGTAISAWSSVFIASLLCAVELGVSGTVPLGVAIPAMALWHIMIGIGEAIITVIAISFIYQTRPDMLHKPPKKAELRRSVRVGD
jgi:cobalt/nickel transport system permease protein